MDNIKHSIANSIFVDSNLIDKCCNLFPFFSSSSVAASLMFVFVIDLIH